MKFFLWLENWYFEQCNENWEHVYGMKIETLDNPGWSVKIDLNETLMADKTIQDIMIERNANNWVSCKIENNQFKGYGGPLNLIEIISIFKKWVDADK